MRLIIHNNNIFFIVYTECRNRIACMICNCNMLIIRENNKIFRIITTDRQCKFLLKKSRLFVNLIHGNCIFSGCCTEQMLAIRSQCQAGSCIMDCIFVMLLTQSRHTLEKFKFRVNSAAIITVDLNLVTQFKEDIGIFAIGTETNNPRFSLGQRRMSTSSSL